MGLCFSKKEEASSPNEKKAEKPSQPVVEATTEKKQVFVITHNNNKSAAAADTDGKEEKKGETPRKKTSREVETNAAGPVLVAPVVEEFRPTAVVRTSSCTKEEVDAILIQCGRLSRSSSEKTSNETVVRHRKYSGSKRSYDFDSEKGEEEGDEWAEKPASRPSPHRRTPGRERSGSRERGSGGGGGGRRVSRSPGRRSELPALSGSIGERSKQPARMVAVPAREKGRGISPAAPTKRGGETGAMRSASPRSRSLASTIRASNENASSYHIPPPPNQPQSLSRSSSRKAEQSPYRRNPMAEIDENSLRANQNVSNTNNKIQKVREGEEGIRKKSSEHGAQVSRSLQRNGAATELTNLPKCNNLVTDRVREQLMGCGGKEQQMEPAAMEEAMEKASSKVTEVSSLVVAESQNPRTFSRTRSSRRSSRDLDHALGLNQEPLLNPNSYASLLLEDIQNYHQQQHPNTAFSLPACVSKACSILEAVADLSSTCSENKSLVGDNGRRGLAPRQQPFAETEMVSKDDLLEPSLHKYVTVRDFGGSDMEPQESAGSNSFVGQPWEPNSVDSTDPYWTSRSNNNNNNGDEVEQEAKLRPLSNHSQCQRQQQIPQESETRGRRSRGVSGNSSSHLAPATLSENKREFYHRSGTGAKAGGGRAHSLPVSAAAAGS